MARKSLLLAYVSVPTRQRECRDSRIRIEELRGELCEFAWRNPWVQIVGASRAARHLLDLGKGGFEQWIAPIHCLQKLGARHLEIEVKVGIPAGVTIRSLEDDVASGPNVHGK